MKKIMGKLLGLITVISALVFTAYASCSVYFFVRLIRLKCQKTVVTQSGIGAKTVFSTEAIPAIVALAITFIAAVLVVLRIITDNRVNYVASTVFAVTAVILLLVFDVNEQIHSFFTGIIGMNGAKAADLTAMFEPLAAAVITVLEALHLTFVIGSGALKKPLPEGAETTEAVTEAAEKSVEEAERSVEEAEKTEEEAEKTEEEAEKQPVEEQVEEPAAEKVNETVDAQAEEPTVAPAEEQNTDTE